MLHGRVIVKVGILVVLHHTSLWTILASCQPCRQIKSSIDWNFLTDDHWLFNMLLQVKHTVSDFCVWSFMGKAMLLFA